MLLASSSLCRWWSCQRRSARRERLATGKARSPAPGTLTQCEGHFAMGASRFPEARQDWTKSCGTGSSDPPLAIPSSSLARERIEKSEHGPGQASLAGSTEPWAGAGALPHPAGEPILNVGSPTTACCSTERAGGLGRTEAATRQCPLPGLRTPRGEGGQGASVRAVTLPNARQAGALRDSRRPSLPP